MKKTVFALGLILAGMCQAEDSIMSQQENASLSHLKTGIRLYHELKEPAKNLLISPLSIGTAMDMALLASSGETELEMGKILLRPADRQDREQQDLSLQQEINRLQDAGVVLNSANALFVTSGTDLVQDSYRNAIQKNFQGEIFEGLDVDPVNEWVEQKTQGKIKKLLSRLHPNSVCALLNAVYFKGLWARPFDAESTFDGEFLGEQSTVEVPLMQTSQKMAYLKKDSFQAIAMPYQNEELQFVVLLPEELQGLSALEDELGSQELANVLAELQAAPSVKVDLTLPRFSLEWSSSLVDAFRAIGLKSPFSPEKAEFERLTGRKNSPGLVYIDQIQHKAVLEVNEEGSEGAAATAIAFAVRSMARPITFRADHPFMFMIVDSRTASVLFLGRVAQL